MTTYAASNVIGLAPTDTLQTIIDNLSAAGGGVVRARGQTFTLSSPLIVKDDVTLDLEGGKLLFNLSGANDYGVRLRNRSHVCNGEIEVVSTGSPGSQAGIHAPVVVGPFYGEGGTSVSPSVDEGVAGWSARNLKVWTNRDGKVGVQVIGGANAGLIENIEIPDNSTMAGAVHLDWGFVGTINSGDVPGSRTNFNAGTAWTTHPHNIDIRAIKIGAMSRTKSGVDTGSHGVRLSGCFNVRVDGVHAKQTTYAAVRHTAGDLGFEFALAAVKPMRLKGNRFTNVTCEDTTDSWLVYVDSYADNVAAAVSGSGYSPLLDPLHETDLLVSNVSGKGRGGASATAGLDIRQIRGGRFVDIDAEGYQHGCLVDEQVYGCEIHGRFHGNRGHGIYIHHGTFPPEDVRVLPGTHCYQNGQDGGFGSPSGICLQSCVRVVIDGALLGHRTAASETTQQYGIQLSSVTRPTAPVVKNCHVFSVKSAGTAYLVMTSTDYGFLRLWQNNSVASAVTNKYSGVDIIPVNRVVASDGTERGHYVALRTVLTADTTPGSGTWVTGDIIFHATFTGANTGTRCTAGGSPGTWGLF